MPCSQNTNRQKSRVELPMEALPALVLLHIGKKRMPLKDMNSPL